MAGSITTVAGSSQSGKSTYVMARTARARRVIVWDSKTEYSGRIVRSPANLLATLRHVGKGAERVIYRPGSLSEFEWWSKCAHAWVVQYGAAAIVAEELASVTSPGKAPPAWGNLVRMVRATGADVYAVTQRPAESDKTALGNSSVIHCGRLTRAPDRRYMAAEMNLDQKILDALKPFEWVERHECGKFARGVTKKLH